MKEPVEEEVANQAKRLYPHIRDRLHTHDELSDHARKLYPHIEENFLQDIGKGVVSAAASLLRKALWALGFGLLAWHAPKWFVMMLKIFSE